jgi:hypothetical protein
MSSAQDAYDTLRAIRMDATALQARITDLFNILNELNLQDTKRPPCPDCGLTFKTTAMLDEHLYLSHVGPVPPHWLAAEARSAGDWEPPPQPHTLREE